MKIKTPGKFAPINGENCFKVTDIDGRNLLEVGVYSVDSIIGNKRYFAVDEQDINASDFVAGRLSISPLIAKTGFAAVEGRCLPVSIDVNGTKSDEVLFHCGTQSPGTLRPLCNVKGSRKRIYKGDVEEIGFFTEEGSLRASLTLNSCSGQYDMEYEYVAAGTEYVAFYLDTAEILDGFASEDQVNIELSISFNDEVIISCTYLVMNAKVGHGQILWQNICGGLDSVSYRDIDKYSYEGSKSGIYSHSGYEITYSDYQRKLDIIIPGLTAEDIEILKYCLFSPSVWIFSERLLHPVDILTDKISFSNEGEDFVCLSVTDKIKQIITRG